MGYFIERKFEVPEVLSEIAQYGFSPGNYQRVIVTWGATDDALTEAAKANIEIWDFPRLLHEIADEHSQNLTYFTDDTARTVQLFAMASKLRSKMP